MRTLSRIALLFLLALVAALSCQEPVTLPPVKGPPLKIPEARGRGAAVNRALTVIYVSPKGQLQSPHTQITVSFSKPMVSLEKVEDRAKLAPLELTPRVAGKQRWLGSRTLTFVPDKPLPGSTEFALRVPAGLKALDGTELEKEERWSFTTPLLAVSSVTPYRGSRWEKPDTVVSLYFNQSVRPATLEKHAALLVSKGGEKLTVAVRVKEGKSPAHMVLHPATELPLDADVTVRVAPEMTSAEGPRPMGAAYTSFFRTYGPFRVTGLSCKEECDPESSVELRFSNPVARDLARKATKLNGTALAAGSSSWPSASVYLDQRLKARTRYAVAVTAGLKDRFGQTLETKGTKLSFVTGDYSPYVHLPIQSGVLEASAPRNLPIYFRNAQEARLYSKRLDPQEAAGLMGHEDFWNHEKVILPAFQGKKQELKVAGQKNARVKTRVNLTALMGGKKHGLLALELESKLPGRRRRYGDDDAAKVETEVRRALVRITDLAVTAKYSPHATLVWVTSLASGKPVEGATISIWKIKEKSSVWSGKTDAAGLALAPGVSQLGASDDSHRFLFVAEKGDDLSFVDSQTQNGIRAWDFGLDETWDDERRGALGMLFTDRGIYRPGDTVHVKGLVRKAGARQLVTPRGEKVDLTVNDARGEKLTTRSIPLSEFGSFAIEVKLPAGAPLGSYGVSGKLPGGGQVYGSFSVEEYRPAEFKVAVSSERRQYVRGDAMPWSTSADYLFGSPMRGAGYRWYLNRNQASFAPPEHDGFVFADEVWWWGEENGGGSGFVAQGQGKLDSKGKASGTVTLKPPKMRGPESYELEVTVTDISRQTISSRTSVLLHPGEFYVGAKPKETFLTAGQSLETEVVAASPEGKRLVGVPIEGTLYLRTWTSVRKQGMGGSHYFVTRPIENEVGSCKLKSAAKPERCSIKLPKAGYFVLRLRATDKRQNPLMTSFGVYASGPEYVAWKRDNESKVELVTDRKSYKVGQVARILVKSPYAGAHGLFTVERNGIYTRKGFKLDRTSAWFEVPITGDLVPTAYVSVMLVRGRVAVAKEKKKAPRQGGDDGDAGASAATEEDPGKPAFKVGYAKLVISQAQKHLKVKVQPARSEYRPGDEVVVDLDVKDAAGKGAPAELTVFAADEGVLSLIGYKTPDPMSIFYAERGLSVRTADNRLQLISQKIFGEKGTNPGGGGAGEGGGGDGPRRNFVTTPYFNPSVLTDQAGRAQIRFKLPDNLTTFRIMAVAASREAEFGSAQSSLKVNKPLLLLPTLPRLVRVGDQVETGVVVHNRTAKGGEVRVTASVRGLQLDGQATKNLSLGPNGSAEARFSFTAVTPGIATFNFNATMLENGDKLELKRPVKLPLVIEAVAAFGSTDSGASEGLVPASGVRSDVGGLEVAMASTALVGLKPGMEYLLDYPYECLEQTTSRLVPLVQLRELRKAFGLKTDGDPDALIAKLVARAERMQRWDGGFSYWPSGYMSFPWASAYATWGLLQAERKGHKVSKRVLTQARSYLRSELNRRVPKDEEKLRRELQAYLVYVLTELGEKTASYLAALHEKRSELAAFSKALLLSAMVKAKSDGKMIEALTQELVNQVHQTGKTARVEENLGDGYEPFFHSDTRSTALVLQALLGAQPDHPLVEKMVKHLLEARLEGRWRNTQETAFALCALHDYFRVREKETPAFVAKIFLGETKLLEKEFQGRSLASFEKTIPMKDLQGGGDRTVGFVKEGPGRLYYSARLRYARTTLPKEPWDEGFYVTRSYEKVSEDASSFAGLRGGDDLDKEKPGVQAVGAGDLVRVTLKIVAPQQMSFVAVDDPLPAGLEAMNFRLMTASQSLAGARGFGFRPSYGRRHYGSAWYTPFYHQEIRDDRVQLFADTLPPGVHTYVYLARATTIGKFVAAPTHVEQMYSPEVFGRTAASHFSVTEK
jgi:hypothetical protein